MNRALIISALLTAVLIGLTGCPDESRDTTPPAQLVSINELNVNGTDLSFMLVNTNSEAVQIQLTLSPTAPANAMIEFDTEVVIFSTAVRIPLAASGDTNSTKLIRITGLANSTNYMLIAITFDTVGNSHSETTNSPVTTPPPDDTTPPAQSVSINGLSANITDLSFMLVNPNSEAVQIKLTLSPDAPTDTMIEFDSEVSVFSTAVRVNLAADGEADATKQIRILGVARGTDYTLTATTFDTVGNQHNETASDTISIIAEPTAVSEVAAGVYMTCVRFDNGEVKCWGNNADGQLGQGNTNIIGAGGSTLSVAAAPVIDFGTGRTAQQMSAGTSSVCALLDNNTVKCWGRNDLGQLGQGHTRNIGDGGMTDGVAHLSVANAPPIDFGMNGEAPLTARQVSVGNRFACALLSNGGVKCWGNGRLGILGQGHQNNIGDGIGASVAETPVLDFGTDQTAATQVSSGTQHACALLNGGEIKCWGAGGNGQLGTGAMVDKSITPTADTVDLGMDGDGVPLTAIQVEAGDRFTCAVLNDNSVKCWGRHDESQLGLNTTLSRLSTPTTAIDFGDSLTATQIDVNQQDTLQNNPFVCARLNDGSAKCWGNGFHGQLGQGHIGNDGNSNTVSIRSTEPNSVPIRNPSVASVSPIELGTGRTATQIIAGFRHACALLDNGGVKCWGRGTYGALGQGSTRDIGRGPDQLGDNLPEIDFGF